MRTLNFARSAIWLLILGCWVGIGFPAVADPRAVTPSAGDPAESSALSNGVGSQFELVFWQSVSPSEDRHQLEAYLAQYPNGTFSGLARAKIAALDRRDASNTARNSSLAATVVPPLAAAASSRSESAGDDLSAVTELPAAAVPAAPPAVVAPVEIVKPTLPPAAPAATPWASAPTPGQSSMLPSLAEQLRALGQSQGRRPEVAPSPPIP